MIRSTRTNNPPDAQRLPPQAVDHVSAMMTAVTRPINALIPIERTIYTALWMLIARASAPIVIRNLPYKPEILQTALDHLIAERLLWYDDAMRAVLQCPPFSALHTPHEVKTFGWERAYVVSFIDVPLALLIYGPNTWMDVQTACPRSGEILKFRVKMDDAYTLQVQAPAEASEWRVWIPMAAASLLSLGPQGERPRISAFRTQADLDTHHQYHTPEAGMVYTFEQAVYVSECLIGAYRQAF